MNNLGAGFDIDKASGGCFATGRGPGNATIGASAMLSVVLPGTAHSDPVSQD